MCIEKDCKIRARYNVEYEKKHYIVMNIKRII